RQFFKRLLQLRQLLFMLFCPAFKNLRLQRKETSFALLKDPSFPEIEAPVLNRPVEIALHISLQPLIRPFIPEIEKEILDNVLRLLLIFQVKESIGNKKLIVLSEKSIKSTFFSLF